jgi:hypothetical protein
MTTITPESVARGDLRGPPTYVAPSHQIRPFAIGRARLIPVLSAARRDESAHLTSKALTMLRDRRRPVRTRSRSSQGQSLAEFALVVPILLMLVIAIGDFGRIFATGLLLETAARDGAEIASNEYLAKPPGIGDSPPVYLNAPAPPAPAGYYAAIHQKVARAVCEETAELPNSTFDAGTASCSGMPFVMVCIHDSRDDECSENGAAVSAGCTDFTPRANNVHGGSGTPRWAEVRVCYTFTSILDVPLISFGSFVLQRTRTFTIPCYFALGTPDECG